MSTKICKPENDLCRCCHSDGVFKSLYAPYFWLDVEEVVYSDMLKECFNIELTPVTEPSKYMLCMICNTCIQKLQDAALFKRQVQKCEKEFQNYINKVFYEIEIKTEIDNLDFNVEHIVKRLTNNIDKDKKPLSDNSSDTQINLGKIKKETLKDKGKRKSPRKRTAAQDKGNMRTNLRKKKVANVEKIEVDIFDPSTSKVGDDEALADNSVDIEFNISKRETNDSDHAEMADVGDSENAKDYEDEMDFRWSDEDVPAETIDASSKKTKWNGKKKKTAPKKKAAPENKELLVPRGINKVVQRPQLQLQEGVDYKRLGDEFQCCSCEYKYKYLYSLKDHIKSHLNLPRYFCPYCTKGFRVITGLVNHKIEAHNVDDRLKCKACDKLFIFKGQLNIHMNSFHKLGKKRKCDKCDFVAYSHTGITKHLKAHELVKQYHCAHCGKSFKRMNTLTEHERIHTGDKRKVCKECGQAFVQKASLNYHMGKYHPGVEF